MPSIEQSIIRKIIELRQIRGITQLELSEKLGINLNAMARLETGHRHLKATEAYAAAIALEVDIAKLFANEPPLDIVDVPQVSTGLFNHLIVTAEAKLTPCGTPEKFFLHYDSTLPLCPRCVDALMKLGYTNRLNYAAHRRKDQSYA